MAIAIIAIGKKHEDWIKDGIERYQKRLRAPYDVIWELLPHSSYEDDRARQEESDRINDRLDKYDYVILLDERGRLMDTLTIAGVLAAQFPNSKKVALIIGGAFGVTEELRKKADMIWSLSPLVFQHQLVRLVVTEQVYRAQNLARGGKYHHV